MTTKTADYFEVFLRIERWDGLQADKVIKKFPSYRPEEIYAIISRLVTGGYLEAENRDGVTVYHTSTRTDLPRLKIFARRIAKAKEAAA